MKRKFLFPLLGLLTLFMASLHAQVPQSFNYQGIARDAKGNPLSRQTLSLKLSVLPAADAVAPEYEEVQTAATNDFGLYTLQIGAGTPLAGQMKSVTWETGNKYIRVAIDPQGGSDYQDAGTTQLLSVPYALYADRAGSAKSGSERTGAVNSNAAHGAGDVNYLSKFTALNTIGKSQIFDNGTSVGIGTAAPAANASLHIRRTAPGYHLLMENANATSSSSFRMSNDNVANYATFTKYGSTVVGGYAGIAGLYPFANTLGFGNNGPLLNASTGNIGFAITKNGTNKLKIHLEASRERIGIGGLSVPQAPVHFNNTDATSDTVKFTNNTTGHGAADGTELRLGGNNSRLINRENGFLILGTNNTDRLAINGAGNVGIGTTSPGALLDVNGQVKIQGGSPGVDKVLKSDANGLASWQPVVSPKYAWVVQTANVPSFFPNGTGTPMLVASDTVTWTPGKKLLVMGTCRVPEVPPVNFGGYSLSVGASIRVEILYNGMVIFAGSNSGGSPGEYTLPLNAIIPLVSVAGQHIQVRVYNGTGIYDPNNNAVPVSVNVEVNLMAIEL